MRSLLSVLFPLAAASLLAAAEPVAIDRPMMLELPPTTLGQPPSPRALVDAREELRRRFREPLSHAETAAGAARAAEALLDASLAEEDRDLKWLMLAEARRLSAEAGNAVAVDRAIVLASACYEFDAIDAELRSLTAIPLRGLDPPRATALAEVAEKLAERAATDRRLDVAVAAQTLAIRGWQRAGNKAAALRAAARHDEVEAARVQSKEAR
jgi:hypothetical protein